MRSPLLAWADRLGRQRRITLGLMGDVFRAFVGSMPENYDRYLVPLIFEPYAKDMAQRVQLGPATHILELACGTGVVTEQVAMRLAPQGRLTASDLNQGMIDIARQRLGDDTRISWQQADATTLPFEDASFDTVACQFGCMFFPDKPKAMREARRVLRRGGMMLFNTWDRLDRCPVLAEGDAGVRACFPDDPPRFYEVPFSMYDSGAIEDLVRAAGFDDVRVENVRLAGQSLPSTDIATGMIRGGPFATEIEQRGGDVDEVVKRVAARLRNRFGDKPFPSPMSAFVCTATAS